jgi:phage head maturation protease
LNEPARRWTASGAILKGFCAVFGCRGVTARGLAYEIWPGSFDATLLDGRDISALIDHDRRKRLGGTNDGSLKLTLDGRGLFAALTLTGTYTLSWPGSQRITAVL